MNTVGKTKHAKDIDLIKDLGNNVNLSIEGHSNIEGNQIFTPEFIVNDMLMMIGLENINDFSKKILEPASGDGAFTVKILELRLNSIEYDENLLQRSLQALSTIYSIEMDKELLIKQRSNIFTTILNHFRKNKIELSNEYIDLAKLIIVMNFVWGETNINEKFFNKNIIGWYLPIPKINNRNDYLLDYYKAEIIRFAQWNIQDNLIFNYILEEVEYDNSINESELGGLFNEW